MARYTDKNGKIIKLGKEIAQGGEGIVYNYIGDSHLVAKIYKPNKRSLQKGKKIELMSQLYDEDISKFSAWVNDVIYENKKPVGFLMEKISDFKEIHLLYGLNEVRQKYFPNAEWKFLVHAALNTARAIGTLHDKGIVIGDINHSNILVNNSAEIKLIDCDSYQIEYNNKTFICEVGVPEYTSPELQGCSFKTVTRNQNHDCFGLAVMIFKILLLAKHPYSGCGAPSEIENAIKGNYFCYSRKYKHITPIQSTMVKALLNEEIIGLFERAFCNSTSRPTAREWIKALEDFEKNDIIACSNNNRHFYNKNSKCIWCALEKAGMNHFGYIRLNNQHNKKKIKTTTYKSKKATPKTAITNTNKNYPTSTKQITCQNCFVLYPSNLKLCPYCGCDTNYSSNETCPVCGGLYSDTLDVCPTCGYSPTGTNTTTCSSCGNFYDSYLNDCPICGGSTFYTSYSNTNYKPSNTYNLSNKYSKTTPKPVINNTNTSVNINQSTGNTPTSANDIKNAALFILIALIIVIAIILNVNDNSEKENNNSYRQNDTYERNNYYDNSAKEAVVEPTYKKEPIYNPEPVHEEQQSSETKSVQQVQPPQNTTKPKQEPKQEAKKPVQPSKTQKQIINVEKEIKENYEYLFE